VSLYLGSSVDPRTLQPDGGYAVVDPDNLVRHAVCVGMTGSGKTGLCVALLEELAMAGVPLIVIDPKGDMTNLALAFEQHRPEDFAKWVDPAVAKREGVSVEEYARQLSEKWRAGLADSQVGPERVQAFTRNAKVTIWTPGSTSGEAVDVLGSLAAPPEGVADDEEGLLELVVGSVSALLSLVGSEADPVTDPAHLTLSRIVELAWRAGESLDLHALITRLADPPFDKIGVFPVDKFFPRADRMKLAMQLNGLVASPAFAPWSQGSPLDPDAWLAPGEKTPIHVFYLAHLDEPRRMFFVSQLLNRIVAWSRRQPGTSALRALVYFDEVFGYLPPYPKNPPTKKPVLTLMKQARAVGVGTMLVTQNPVDVDYAALSNAGTWFVGRLQTKQDREKVVEGLAGAGQGVDTAQIDDWISQLPSRTFVMRDAGSPAPTLVKTRQVISYLRGPLTRREIEVLSGKATAGGPPPPPGRSKPPAAAQTQKAAPPPQGLTPQPPPAPEGYAYRYVNPDVVFSSRLAAIFEPHAQPAREDGRIVWEPALYARLALQFDEGRDFVLQRDEHRLFYPIRAGRFVEPAFEDGDLLLSAPGPGFFGSIPAEVDEPRELKALERKVVDDVLRGETEKMFRHRELRIEGRAGETRDDFEARVQRAIDDKADAEIAKLKDKVEREVKRIQDKKARLERDLQRHASDARNRQVQQAVSVGESLLGVFFGNRRVTSAVSNAVTRHNQASAASQRASSTEQELGALDREVYELELKVEDEIRAIRDRFQGLMSGIEEIPVRLDAGDVRLTELSIVWVPVTRPV
jgi:DNA helicase HerA-like ATPase